jgi:hypothetical protein
VENLYIINSHTDVSTPNVEFNAETGNCTISGEAFMEQPYSFYKPLFSWVELYIKEVKKPLSLDIKLTYFNTSSSKFVLDLIRMLRKYQLMGGVVTVRWFLRQSDEDMQEEIEDFTAVTGLKIQIISI